MRTQLRWCGNFTIVECRISSRLKWYKNYRLRLAKVIVKNKMSRFYGSLCNVTYCTSGSRRLDTAFQKLRTYQVTQTGVPANATMAPQRYMIYGCWITCGCHLRLCVLSFRFFWPFARPRVVQSARCPVRKLAIRELANPRVVQLPCVYGPMYTWQPYTVLKHAHSTNVVDVRILCGFHKRNFANDNFKLTRYAKGNK